MNVEMKYPGVENSIHVPEHRVERYKARGWKPVTDRRPQVETAVYEVVERLDPRDGDRRASEQAAEDD